VSYTIRFGGRAIGDVELQSMPAIQQRLGSQRVLIGYLSPNEHFGLASGHTTTLMEFLTTIIETGGVAPRAQADIEAAFADSQFSAVDETGTPLNALIQVQDMSDPPAREAGTSGKRESPILVIAVLLGG
jgi:hypothetical protein